MAGLNETPRGARTHIAFFGLRNAGKSTLVNAFTGQDVAIVSDVAGTTTDPVSKSMEILPLGPCVVTDTAGLDDDGGELGAQRVRRSLAVLSTCDVAVWVATEAEGAALAGEEARRRAEFFAECSRRGVPALEYRRSESVEAFKARVAHLRLSDAPPPLLDGLVHEGDSVVCVCPIDGAAPKGRLILPQVQLIRECLDAGAAASVCQPAQLRSCLARGPVSLVVTDSQAFAAVRDTLLGAARDASPGALSAPPPLTSFSILFARQKGDLDEFSRGVEAAFSLRDGDRVLIAEGCTHRRQCNDIGTVKLPKALARLSGASLDFSFVSGQGFPEDAAALRKAGCRLVVQCGGCMLTRREVLRRVAIAREAGVPIANYGLVLAAAAGIRTAPGRGPLVSL